MDIGFQLKGKLVEIFGPNRNQYCGVFRTITRSPNIVHRRKFDQIVEMRFFVWVTEIGNPCMAYRKFMESQHIHDAIIKKKELVGTLKRKNYTSHLPHLGYSRSKQIRSLINASAN